MIFHKSEAVLKYDFIEDYGYRLIAEVDKEISKYYRKLIPKWIDVQPQFYAPHISVVRRETPTFLYNWGKYQGGKVAFVYSDNIKFSPTYCWIDVFSTQLEQIRDELGLENKFKSDQPPDGYKKFFHITIGNFK